MYFRKFYWCYQILAYRQLLFFVIGLFSQHGWCRWWRSRSSSSGRSWRRRSRSCFVGRDEEQEQKTRRDRRLWTWTTTASPNRSPIGHDTVSPRHICPVHSTFLSTCITSSSGKRSSPEWSLVQQVELSNLRDLEHSRSWQTSAPRATEDQVLGRWWRGHHFHTQTSSWQSCLGKTFILLIDSYTYFIAIV